jgi:uncharacterized protein
VSVAELRRRLGSRTRFHARVPLEGLAVSTAEVPPGGEIEVDVQLESISNGLVADGTVTAPWTGECRRCLEPVEGEVEVEVKEIFEREPTEGETYRLGEDQVDLEPMVRDAVLLALPLAPLCRPDCAGPAPDAFPTGPEDEVVRAGAEAARLREERWSALDELRFDEPDEPGPDVDPG